MFYCPTFIPETKPEQKENQMTYNTQEWIIDDLRSLGEPRVEILHNDNDFHAAGRVVAIVPAKTGAQQTHCVEYAQFIADAPKTARERDELRTTIKMINARYTEKIQHLNSINSKLLEAAIACEAVFEGRTGATVEMLRAAIAAAHKTN
jgi:hypothetical protein